jgi:hypothetical protein
MKAALFEIVRLGDHWAILLAAACREPDDQKQVAAPRYLFWTGGTWRYESTLAMKFSAVGIASAYIARSMDRMLVKSTFTSNELRRSRSLV